MINNGKHVNLYFSVYLFFSKINGYESIHTKNQKKIVKINMNLNFKRKKN